jgi:hypothetical protein
LLQIELQTDIAVTAAPQQRSADNDCQSLTDPGTALSAELREISSVWHVLPPKVRATLFALVRALLTDDRLL